jgi:hypothetical protein
VEAEAAIPLIYVAYLSERLGLKGIFRKMVSPLLTKLEYTSRSAKSSSNESLPRKPPGLVTSSIKERTA